jgi:hypothetical protein
LTSAPPPARATTSSKRSVPSTRCIFSSSPGSAGAASIAARTASGVSCRDCAIPDTNCSSIESSNDVCISRAGVAHLTARERLGGALVLADALHLERDAELLEQAAEEQELAGEPDDRRTRRLGDEQLLRRGRHVVFEIAGERLGLEIRDRAPAVLAEPRDRVADLLRLRPADLERAHAQHHRREPAVALGLASRRAATRAGAAARRSGARAAAARRSRRTSPRCRARARCPARSRALGRSHQPIAISTSSAEQTRRSASSMTFPIVEEA